MRLDKFLFCESARIETSGQLTIVGWFPTDSFALNVSIPEGQPFVLPNVSCVAVLDQMNGISEIQIQCDVEFAAAVTQRTPPVPTNHVPADRFHTHVLSFSPFMCPNFGEYIFRLTVEAGGQTTRFSRRLKMERAPQGTSLH